VFAWGATLAFAASGRPCFGGSTLPAVMHQILTAEPELRGLDGTLLTVVRSALAKDPAGRPTAQQLLQRLVSSRQPTTQPSAKPATQPGTRSAPPPPPPSVHAQPPLPPPAMGSDESAALVERQYRLAAEAGDTAAMYNLGVLLNWRGQTAEAEYWYRRAAAAGPQTYNRAPYRTAYNHPGGYSAPTRTHGGAHGYARPRHNSAAVLALTFGVLGMFTCGLPSIPAIIAGHMAWVKVKRTGERGAGMAAAGIALGWIMVAFWVLIAIGWAIGDEGSTGSTP
jgi:hypothetical protein